MTKLFDWIDDGWDCDFCGTIDECDEDKDCCSHCGSGKGEKYSGPKPASVVNEGDEEE